MQYLTETLLDEFLNETYNSEWIHDKQLKAVEEYKDRMISTLITQFNIESNYVNKVPSRSSKCQYIATQIEKLMRGYP